MFTDDIFNSFQDIRNKATFYNYPRAAAAVGGGQTHILVLFVTEKVSGNSEREEEKREFTQ